MDAELPVVLCLLSFSSSITCLLRLPIALHFFHFISIGSYMLADSLTRYLFQPIHVSSQLLARTNQLTDCYPPLGVLHVYHSIFIVLNFSESRGQEIESYNRRQIYRLII